MRICRCEDDNCYGECASSVSITKSEENGEMDTRLGFTERDVDPLGRGDTAQHEEWVDREGGPYSTPRHPTCVEVTGRAEIMAGTRAWMCGMDCVQASDLRKYHDGCTDPSCYWRERDVKDV